MDIEAYLWLAFSFSGEYTCFPFLSHLKYAWIWTSSSGTEKFCCIGRLVTALSFFGSGTEKFWPLFLNLTKRERFIMSTKKNAEKKMWITRKVKPFVFCFIKYEKLYCLYLGIINFKREWHIRASLLNIKWKDIFVLFC